MCLLLTKGLEVVTVTQLINKLPALYGTITITTMFTMVCHWVISCTRQIPYFPQISFHIIIQLCLCLPSGHCLSGLPTKILIELLTFPMQATLLGHHSLFNLEQYAVQDINFDASIYAVFFSLLFLSLFCTHTHTHTHTHSLAAFSIPMKYKK